MSGVLLSLVFAAGIGLIWASAIHNAQPAHLGRILRRPTRTLSLRIIAIAGACTAGFALTAWWLTSIPILALLAGFAGAYLPTAWARRKRDQRQQERERAWPAALAQLADALEAGLAFPAAISLAASTGPRPLQRDFANFHATLRSRGLAAAIDELALAGERTADTVAVFLRAGLLELPAGGFAPVLRDLAHTLSERLEAREKARSRASSLNLEAAILALSPILLLLLAGAASPGYLDAYKTPAGTAVSAVCGLLIFGCYLLMRTLGRIPEPRRTQPR